MLKAMIFDIDGTLLDTNDFHAHAWSRAFAGFGKTVSVKALQPHMGKGSDQLLPEFLSAQEVKDIGKLISKAHSDIYKHDYRPQTRPFPKVRELFKKIKNADIQIALASSADAKDVEHAKIIAQITDLVEHTTSSDDADKSKPHPDIFQAAMRDLGNPAKDRVLVVGDTPYDARAAVAAGLRVAGVLCGGFSEKELRANGCALIFVDPADLLAQLDSVI